MNRINIDKRNSLVSGTAPGCPHSSSAFQLRKPILDRLENSLAKCQPIGLSGLPASGKTSILLSLKARLKKSFGPEIEPLSMIDYLHDSFSISPAFFEKASRQTVALIDEASIVYNSIYPSNLRAEFLNFIKGLAESIPVVISYPRFPIKNSEESPVPNMRTFFLSLRAEDDSSRFIDLIFADTNVGVSDSAKRRIIELGGGSPSAIGDLCYWSARERHRDILGSIARVFIDEDPERLLSPPYSYRFKIQNSILECLTENEKAFLQLLIRGKVRSDDFKAYGNEIVELFELGVLNRRMEILLPVKLAIGSY